MTFETIVASLGEFGSYQKRTFYLLCATTMSCAIQINMSVFTMGIPEHRCAIPSLENDTYSVDSPWHSSVINRSVPWDPEEGFSKCQLYLNDTSRETASCSKWVYDTSQFKETVVSKYDLVCDDVIAKTQGQVIMMSGLMVGSPFSGIIADRFGRKLTLMLAVLLHAASSIGVAFTQTFVAYIIARFLTGFSITGLFLAIVILGMELVGPSKRMFVGVVVEIFWAFGIMILGITAHFVRTWNYLQLALSVPILIFFSYWWLLNESPRWLLTKGHKARAEEILLKAAKTNGVVLCSDSLEANMVSVKAPRQTLWSAFTASPAFCIRLVILCYNWMVISMTYYGLGLNTGSLAGNLYVNFVLMGVVDIIACVYCLLLLNRIGRKPVLSASLLVGGGACLCTIFPVVFGDSSHQWINTLLALVGRCGSSAAFTIAYMYTAEQFPTTARNSLMGLTNFFGRFGGMVSPYVANMATLIQGPLGNALSLMMFGGMAVAGGFLCLLLPETLNKPLPETLEEAINIGRTVKPPPKKTVMEEGTSGLEVIGCDEDAKGKFDML